MKPKILVILGTTRAHRSGDKVAHWFLEVARERSAEADFELVDLADWNLAYYDNPLPPAFAHLDGRTQEWSDLVASADGYVIITPEYNHGYSAVLKNHLDVVYHPWNRKPVGFVSYGGAGGGYRAVEQLREVAVELQMVPIREQVGIPFIWAAFDDNGTLRAAEQLKQFADNLLNDLLWWAQALKTPREKGRAPEPVDEEGSPEEVVAAS